jgi:hypothetical protein
VQSRTDILRAPGQAGDRVSFAVGPEVLHGTISRVNPRYAHVVCDDNREYRVPYARLTPQEPRAATAPRARQRTDGALQALAARATAWITAHQLEGWSFQFDYATTRAGCCNYQTQVISLAHAYARAAPDAANELPRSKLRGIQPPLAYSSGPPVWRGSAGVSGVGSACEP